MLRITGFLLLIHLIRGFLLNIPNEEFTESNGPNQFLTQSEFYDTKKLIQDNIVDLRHEMDHKFEMLTAQLKQTPGFSSGFNQVGTGDRTELEDLTQKYTHLLGNYTNLQM